MWNFNTTGFQSIVEYSPRTKWDAETKKVVTTDKFANELPADYVPADAKNGVRSSHLLVRARIEADLDAMKAYDPNAIVFEDLTADYQFRMIIRREAVAQFQYDLTMGVDYWSHVKEEMNRRSPEAKGRMSAYYRVWNALADIQPNPPYGARKWSAPAPKKTGKAAKPVIEAPKAQSWQNPLWAATRMDFGPESEGGSAVRDLFSDAPLAGWEEDLIAGRYNRKTMEGQVAEMLDAEGHGGDVADITDQLEDAFGTIDLDTVEPDDIWDVIDGFVSVARTEPVSTYTRRHPNGQLVEVSGYKRSKAKV